jgi:hypothetical protein
VLPPHPGRIQVDYSALSVAIPERVRFRYKLEGADSDWQDAGTRRETFYYEIDSADEDLIAEWLNDISFESDPAMDDKR